MTVALSVPWLKMQVHREPMNSRLPKLPPPILALPSGNHSLAPKASPLPLMVTSWSQLEPLASGVPGLP